MSDLWHKALGSMSRGVELRGVLVKSSTLASAAAFFTLPYFHYLIFMVPDQARSTAGLKPWGFLFAQLFLLLILCLLAAAVGLSFANKYNLPGLGDPRDLIASLPLLLALALAMITLSYFLFDRYFYEISPFSYPQNLLYLISLPFQGAFTDEIILRFCLITLFVGLFKRKSIAVVSVSALASLFTIKYFYFFGITLDLSYLFITQLTLSFSSNLILGYLFVSRGLCYSIALKFLFSMKYVVVSWALGP